MMMSIYERTKEIGVMKVLGCDMGNIRNMFLIESGFIGFMGGTIGVALSYGVSAIVNRFVNMSQSMGLSGDLSRIPSWLSMAAIGFAVFVGMAAGFMPAVRAMKLSPLAAIRERIGHRAVHKQKIISNASKINLQYKQKSYILKANERACDWRMVGITTGSTRNGTEYVRSYEPAAWAPF